MKSKVFKIMVVLATAMLLSLPGLVLTQGTVGRVLNRRLRRVYATISAAVADPALLPGDVLLIAGRLVEPPGGVVIPAGWSGTIVSETRAAFVANISIQLGGCPPTGAVIDTSLRGGLVQIIGGNITVPPACDGILADGTFAGGANPLTTKNVQISPATAGPIGGIEIWEEFGGPFNLENNTITRTNAGGFGISVDGDPGTGPLTATIRSNKIGTTAGMTVGVGIWLTDIPAGWSTATVSRNVVDGLSSAASWVGIFLTDADDSAGAGGVTVNHNTIRNFTAPAPGGTGIAIDNSAGATITYNKVQNNAWGIVVDPWNDSGATPAINNNSITGTGAQVSLVFDPFGVAVTYNLDASNNYWGGNQGAADTTVGSFCGGPTVATCGTASGNGRPVSSPGAADDCDESAVGSVDTCPFRPTAPWGVGA